jgi:hypothetical protein
MKQLVVAAIVPLVACSVLAAEIKARTTPLATGNAVMERLGSARGQEIGFTMVSGIRQGESYGGSLVGSLPTAIQRYTPFEAVVITTTASPEAAHAFVRAITAPAARQRLAASGWEH